MPLCLFISCSISHDWGSYYHATMIQFRSSPIKVGHLAFRNVRHSPIIKEKQGKKQSILLDLFIFKFCSRRLIFCKSILDKVVEFSLLTHAACLGNVKDYFEGHGTCLPITALLLTRAMQSCNARIVLLISFTSSIFIWAIIIHESTINLAFLYKSNWTWMQKKSVNLFPEHFIKTTIKWFSILSFVILFLAPIGALEVVYVCRSICLIQSSYLQLSLSLWIL